MTTIVDLVTDLLGDLPDWHRRGAPHIRRFEQWAVDEQLTTKQVRQLCMYLRSRERKNIVKSPYDYLALIEYAYGAGWVELGGRNYGETYV